MCSPPPAVCLWTATVVVARRVMVLVVWCTSIRYPPWCTHKSACDGARGVMYIYKVSPLIAFGGVHWWSFYDTCWCVQWVVEWYIWCVIQCVYDWCIWLMSYDALCDVHWWSFYDTCWCVHWWSFYDTCCVLYIDVYDWCIWLMCICYTSIRYPPWLHSAVFIDVYDWCLIVRAIARSFWLCHLIARIKLLVHYFSSAGSFSLFIYIL